MSRAVLDSSVLVSAFITPGGRPARVLDAAERDALTLCLSHEIIAETATVLLRSAKLQACYGFDESAAKAFCDGLAGLAELVVGLPKL